MRRYPKPRPEPEQAAGHFVLCSECVILKCVCGEKLVLLGLEEDLYAEGRTIFECECGRKVTLADRTPPYRTLSKKGVAPKLNYPVTCMPYLALTWARHSRSSDLRFSSSSGLRSPARF